MGVPHPMQKGEDDFAGLVRIGSREDAFPNTLMDDRTQHSPKDQFMLDKRSENCYIIGASESGAMVAHLLPKQRVAGSNPVSRSSFISSESGSPSSDRRALAFM